MATVIKSINDLNKILETRIKRALELTRDEIFDVLKAKVEEYYDEPVFSPPDRNEPDYYSRTEELKKQFKKSAIKENGNNYGYTIGWDDEYLTFIYSKGEYNGITGLQVLQAFNDSTHGYTVSGEHDYWDEGMEKLGGKSGIINLFKNNLRKCGVSVK